MKIAVLAARPDAFIHWAEHNLPHYSLNRSRLVAKPPIDGPVRWPAYFYIAGPEFLQGIWFNDVIMLEGFWWRSDAQETIEALRVRLRRDA